MNAETAHQGQVKVWDLFVRIFHWTLVAAFAVAYVTEDEAMALHVWAGYLVGGLVLARIVWGFVGPKHARFSEFICGPANAWGYLIDLFLFRRYSPKARAASPDKPVLFLHPKDFCGTLVELEQA